MPKPTPRTAKKAALATEEPGKKTPARKPGYSKGTVVGIRAQHAVGDPDHYLIRTHLESPMEMVKLVRDGVPWSDFNHVVEELGFTRVKIAGVLKIAPRTLERRKGERLDHTQSERFVRFLRLVNQATAVLGTREKAIRWLEAPNRALNGIIPMSLLDTDVGTREVETVLTRIEFGVFS